jgi:hypothetical protein
MIEAAQKHFINKLFKTGKTVIINFGFDYPNLVKYTKPYNSKAKKIVLHFVGINLIGWNKKIVVPASQALRINRL